MNDEVDPPALNLSAELSTERWTTSWLEDLLCTVHYNFPLGLVFYCVSCSKGLFQAKDFEEGAHHSGHRRLKMDSYQGEICVNQVDIESHDVNTAEVQKFSYNDSFFIFLHNAFGYGNKVLPEAKPDQNCAHCHTKLLDELEHCQIKFCCLECKFYGIADCKEDSLSTMFNIPILQTPLPCDLPLPRVTYAQVTAQGVARNRESQGRRILKKGNASGFKRQNVASPHEMSDSSDMSGADVHEHSVQEVLEDDQIRLPKALYEELEVRSFYPCDEILSMNTADHRCSASFPEAAFVERLSSYGDTKQVKIQPSEETSLIPNPREFMTPTIPLFRDALAAAFSSSMVDEWGRQQTPDCTNRDWDVEGDGMPQVEGRGRTPESLNDNVLRKAAHLLRIFVSEVENKQSFSCEDNTNSEERSVSSEGTGLELSISSISL